PLIKESEKMDLLYLEAGLENLQREFPLPTYKISIVHGKMPVKDKDFEMQRFVKGETQIMVATTVIEVGVNVPNASVMVIENAEPSSPSVSACRAISSARKGGHA